MVKPQEAAPSDESVEVRNRTGRGEVLLLCEHAAYDVPARYHGLGLDPAHARSHAAWDPGARAVALLLSEALDAPLVASRVSRLVYDCNRPPEAESAMPALSEVIPVPGNRSLTPEQRQERIDTIYRPFCAAVEEILTARRTAGLPTAVITVHSFTPVFHGQKRAVEIGILHDSDTRLADAILAEAERIPHRRIRRNEPYEPADGVTHSLQLHGIANALHNVMIEIRNDLIATPDSQAVLAEELLQLIRPALDSLRKEER